MAVVVAFGGQTAIKLTKHLDEIRRPDPRDPCRTASMRRRTGSGFDALLEESGDQARRQGDPVMTTEEALAADQVRSAYPSISCVPSYVLGGYRT